LNQPIPTPLGNNTIRTSVPADFSFANITPINVPALGGNGGGLADPYPSIINVSGVSGTVSLVKVRLLNFSHTFPDDVDVLLISPTGRNLILMSDAGGGIDMVNNTITIDDSAVTPLPNATAIGTDTFQPADHGTGDTFPGLAPPYLSPAPVGANTLTSVFSGDEPNGVWQLIIVDDSSGDAGIVNGGWELIITTEGDGGGPPCVLTCPADIIVGNDPGSCSAAVNYPSATTQGNCGEVIYSHPSGSQFPIGTTMVTVMATRSDMTTQTCTFNVTVTNNQGPTIKTHVALSSLGPPFDHRLVNVGLRGRATANCSAIGAVQVTVYSDEDDGFWGFWHFAPDAKEIAFGTLRLRRQRNGWRNGRVYLIISSVTDAVGNAAHSCETVTVPHSNSRADRARVKAQADAARAQCQATGAPPAGYFVIGDVPTRRQRH
jgi:subtilisin-like proprotein convertase family protein